MFSLSYLFQNKVNKSIKEKSKIKEQKTYKQRKKYHKKKNGNNII